MSSTLFWNQLNFNDQDLHAKSWVPYLKEPSCSSKDTIYSATNMKVTAKRIVHLSVR